ncbi:hypothetical protein SAMN05216371_7906 [Streptomyces sp. TLI_053]|uniref:hypothetical protein n=1 Tax=Streptomyces sp. TLI_053 TaxID=1855352 RepID=UPI00087B7806|nr:hypothetical protein [Streptomyces sp. TLI_053]SDT83093.1 hypothetical protein SAMN05216371_7906 [Streptomyces sp. TLI_053]
MTDERTALPALLRRLPLDSLYPAAYRAAHGEEINAVLADAVQHAGPRTALREWAALAAHAVRLRTRLGSSDPAGRILAGAAPPLLAGGAALSLLHLLFGTLPAGPDAHWEAGAAQSAPWILGLLFATLGRWAPARAMLLVAALLPPITASVGTPELPGLWTVTALLVLIAPPDAVDLSRRGRSWAIGSAAAVALPLSGLTALWLDFRPEDYPHLVLPPLQQALLDLSPVWAALVLGLAHLLRLARPNADPLHAGGIALAVLPWTLTIAPPLHTSTSTGTLDLLLRNVGMVLAFLAATTAIALAILRRRTRHPHPTEPARPRASGPTA